MNTSARASHPVLFFESIGGASGDMCLGALVDLGVPVDLLQSALDSLLGTGTVALHHSHREEHGIRASRLFVEVMEKESHHRHLPNILEMIGGSPLDERVKQMSGDVFRRLAEAEARVHGIAVDKVHFHEVGALDAIADIVGTCLAIHHLSPAALYSGALKTGRGTVRAAHGVLPVPAPATLALAEGRTLQYLDMEGELTTPTGAALLTVLTEERLTLSLRPERTGYGCGERSFPELPNLLRVSLGTLVQA